MSNVIIDGKQVERFIDNLSDEQLKRKIIFNAIYSGAKELQSATQSFFKNAMGESASHVSKYIRKPFYEGVTVSGNKAYLETVVSIMKDFRMKFFEKGTNERYIKQTGHSDYSRKKKRYIKNTGKPNYRGKIIGKHFFKDATQTNKERINYAILQSIDNAIKKL